MSFLIKTALKKREKGFAETGETNTNERNARCPDDSRYGAHD